MIFCETERLIIREWELKDSDIDDLYEIGSDPVTNKFLTYPLYTNRDTAIERIKYCESMYPKTYVNEDMDYAIELKSSHKVVGTIAVMGYTSKADGVCELGYQLGSKYFKNGYMTEAVKGVINKLFTENIVSRVQAKHDVNNPASGEVMKRAGMTFEGILRKSSANNSSPRIDIAMYSILKEEYIK